MTAKRVEHTRVGGVPAALVSENDLLALLVEDCAAFRAGSLKRAITVMDTNGQALSMYATDAAYAQSLEAADLVHADGQFIIWGSKLGSGGVIPERTATTDMFISVAETAVKHDLSFFLLGGSEEVNAACAKELEKQFPGLRISGRRNGYYSDEEEADVIDEINASNADIVWVGLGKPKEQIFSERNKFNLNCAWIITCGGCFHFFVGDYARAPAWMQKIGLEWLHRMATGPRYLIWRYLVTIPHAIGLVLYKNGLQPLWGGRRKKPS